MVVLVYGCRGVSRDFVDSTLSKDSADVDFHKFELLLMFFLVILACTWMFLLGWLYAWFLIDCFNLSDVMRGSSSSGLG